MIIDLIIFSQSARHRERHEHLPPQRGWHSLPLTLYLVLVLFASNGQLVRCGRTELDVFLLKRYTIQQRLYALALRRWWQLASRGSGKGSCRHELRGMGRAMLTGPAHDG